MSSIGPWLAVAGVGALHGLNPATGWMFAAARGVRSRDSRQALQALLPIALGHAASVALVAAAVALAWTVDRMVLQVAAGALLAGIVLHQLWRRARQPAKTQTGLMLWSCMMSTAHGAGMMLVPAFIPLCSSGTPASDISASGSLLLGLAAVALHSAAMLAVTGAIATAVSCGLSARLGSLAAMRASARRGLARSAWGRVFGVGSDCVGKRRRPWR